jgi:hypothetical protein
MAKTKDEDKFEKVMWLVGGALITGATIYFVNQYLQDRKEMMKLQVAHQQALTEGD